jgi:regulator of sirC expression with transglutaminase-like and TPR domain
MTPANKLRSAGARREFAKLVSAPGRKVDLALAALLIAAEESNLDVGRYVAQLDTWGLQARDCLALSADEPVEELNRFIFHHLGFHGNQDQYFDPENSFLNRVIDRRAGIPITLSLIYMEVGRRAGLKVEGVSMPGHFIVRVIGSGRTGDVLIDPFNRKRLSLEECQGRLDESFAGEIRLEPEHLLAATDRQILVRLLTNLKAIYTRNGSYGQAISIVDRILLVAPSLLAERRDRGLLLAQSGRIGEAAAELEHYLRLAKNASDHDRVQEELKKVNQRQAALN